ncbi:MAG TPA: TIGR03936 family radical SAM-associated protein [bacterium]|nr:TIGR03936 family radical SAM-associated protein [bacterium]HOL34788.1 TIGR03936 family radical SAM-associated protein [bacterium]HPP07753.1 TIGR03936 family radical SAM-associated protein [bacterium]
MPVLRMIYERQGVARFISVNYIGKIFERAVRRLQVNLEFSYGYSRRVRISLGPPVAVGISGVNEVIDIHVKDRSISADVIKNSLNEVLPEGLKITECRYLIDGEKSPPEIKKARYRIRQFPDNIGDMPESWDVISKNSDMIEIEVWIEKFKHRDLFDIFGTSCQIERKLIF